MRILLVEDQAYAAAAASQELLHALPLATIDLANNPLDAIRRLSESRYDVAIIDMLFRAVTEEFEHRRRQRQVRLDDEVLHLSGLAVLHAINSLGENRPQSVIWTSGEPNRHLHLLFAYEELGVRVFCAKETLGNLPNAVKCAYAGDEYIDPKLSYYVPNKNGRRLGETILSQPKKLQIWRSMALGQHRHGIIARLTGVSPKTVRTSMGEMRKRLVELDPGLTDQNGPTTEVISYASQNREFFLDDTVRRLFP